MKKINLISILAFSVILFIGCYDDSKNAKVRINLGNIPVAKQIEKKSLIDKVFSIFVKDAYAQTAPSNYNVYVLHLAVYSGDILVAKESIDATDIAVDGSYNSYVEVSAPSGNNMTILVVGEYNLESTYANYYGYNSADLVAGKSTDVTIQMINARWDGSVGVDGVTREIVSTPICGPAPFTISWTSAGIKARYIIIDYSGESPVIKYSGYETQYIDSSNSSIELYVEFEDFNLRTYGDSPSSGC